MHYAFDSSPGLGRSIGHIVSLHEDRRGVLWVGTRDGLCRLDPATGAFEKFTIKDGLPDNWIASILEDASGDLWLATTNGLSHFSPEKRQFRNYSELDGLPSNRFNLHGEQGACLTPEGEMVFGTTDGFTIFNPARLTTNPYRPPVVLTEFLLFNKPTVPGMKESPLTQPIWATESVTLDSSQQIFSVEFAALSYSAPQRNRYRFRLENFEDNWNEVDSSRRTATYTNLPAGQYVFHVQGSNNDLLWSETSAQFADHGIAALVANVVVQEPDGSRVCGLDSRRLHIAGQ